MDHCDLNIDEGKLECLACGRDFDLKFPQPLWAVSALSKAFVKVHADCKRVMDEKGELDCAGGEA